MRKLSLLERIVGVSENAQTMPEALTLTVTRLAAMFAEPIAPSILSPLIAGDEAVLLRAYAQDEQFVAIFPNCLQARLDHLFGCITPGLRILFHLAPRQTRIKACVALASAITFPESASSTRPLQVVLLSRPRNSIVEFE